MSLSMPLHRGHHLELENGRRPGAQNGGRQGPGKDGSNRLACHNQQGESIDSTWVCHDLCWIKVPTAQGSQPPSNPGERQKGGAGWRAVQQVENMERNSPVQYHRWTP